MSIQRQGSASTRKQGSAVKGQQGFASTRTKWIVLLTAAACLAGAFVTYAAWPKQPKRQASTQGVVDPDEFARLSLAQQQEYFDNMRQARGTTRPSFTDQDRRDMRQNMQVYFQRRIEEYYKLPAEDRNAYLDKMIDEGGRGFGGGGGGGGGGPPAGAAPGGPGGGRAFSAERMRNRVEGSDPKAHAQQVAFRRAIRQRMQERGIQPPAGRGGNRGG